MQNIDVDSEIGLSSDAVVRKLKEEGYNELSSSEKRSIYREVLQGGLTFNGLLGEMATVLKDHPNVILGLWNEPVMSDQERYDTYWFQLPASLTVTRAAGFVGIVVVMGEVAFAPSSSQFSGMGWVIDHVSLFTVSFGSVVAVFMHTIPICTIEGPIPIATVTYTPTGLRPEGSRKRWRKAFASRIQRME